MKRATCLMAVIAMWTVTGTDFSSATSRQLVRMDGDKLLSPCEVTDGSPQHLQGQEMGEMNLMITAPWQFQFDGECFCVPKVTEISVADEKYENLPLHQSRGGWNDGMVLRHLAATGCSLPDALIPESLSVKSAAGVVLTRGKDYEITDKWATFGRLEGGRIGPDTKVLISYRYIPMRLDSVVRTADGKNEYRTGKPASFTPALPELQPGETRLLNVYLDALTTELTTDSLFPILQSEPLISKADSQQAFIPKTLEKLRNGGKVKILAWGDSVTDGSYLPEKDRWQQQFITRLRARFPNADIELLSNGWGGRTIPAFLREPAGSKYNYEETVLAVQPDLVISEFVNDAALSPKAWEQSFPKVLQDFRARGYEWIILTPHYIRPEGMGFASQNGEAIENDPRPYVHYLRKFASENNVALADAAKLYGQLWRCGIPYNVLMTNNINHPDCRGMKLFADALMAIFD